MIKSTIKNNFIVLLCMISSTVAHAQGAPGFKEVLISADYSKPLSDRLLACNLALTNESKDTHRIYEFQLSKSFGSDTSRETLMVDLDQDRVTHARAEPNFKDLDASAQDLIPTMQFSSLNTKNLPYSFALGGWMDTMIVGPGRYLEVRIKDAPWEPGALDLLKAGYSIQALIYNWNGTYPKNFKTKSEMATGEEVLLPFTKKSSGPSPDFDDEVLEPFSYMSDLQSHGESFHLEVICK